MRLIKPDAYTGDRAWAALDIERFDAATVRMHWTDQPYRWHRNTGDEVFVVLDGQVEMKYREAGDEKSMLLEAGDALAIGDGEEHVAHPVGEARILVIEDVDSD